MNESGLKGVEEFLVELGSTAPAPGGGAAAALTGAMAAALVEMVAGISSRRAAPQEGGLGRIRQDAEEIRTALTKAIEEDAAAYGEVAKALNMPKTTEAEKAARRQALARALRRAAEVPLSTARAALRVLDLCEELVPLASRHLQSDIAAAAQLARAATCTALYNVDANCLWIRDQEFLTKMRPLRVELSQEADRKTARLLTHLETSLTSWLGERDSNPH